MSPTAFLVGRENVNNCSHQLLTTIVDRLVAAKGERELYSIVINRKHQLTFTKVVNPDRYNKTLPTDEGFESDIDSASLLSSDGDSVNFVEKNREIQISDSANSSSASDSSDTEIVIQKTPKVEHFQLDNVVCYTNIRFPKTIGFVAKRDCFNDFIVFEFTTTQSYDRIRYAFNSLNNAAVNKNVTTPNHSKFNLVQRTDKNGVTHIEISRENNLLFQHTLNNTSSQPSSIISINTPEVDTQADRNLLFDFKLSNLSKLRSNSHADLLNDTRLHTDQSVIKSRSNSHANLLDESQYSKNLNSNSLTSKSRSNSHADLLNEISYRAKNLESVERRQEIDGVIRADIDAESIDTKKLKTLNVNLNKNDEPILKKVWRSAEDILDSEKDIEPPKKPERRRKTKGKAPPPPNVMKGQYVRVSVDPNKKTEPTSSLKLATFETNKLDNYNSNWVYVASQPSSLVLTTCTPQMSTPQYEPFKNASASEFRTEFVDHSRAFTLNRKNREASTKNFEYQKWTNSVPRMPKMPRSRSENRYSKNNPYKYVDTTAPTFMYTNNFQNCNRYNPNNNFSTHSLPSVNNNLSTPTSISNRLFGLSQKLKEFGTNVVNTNHRFVGGGHEGESHRRRSSLGELSYKSNVANLTSRYGSTDNSNLKSVIKKTDDRKIKNNNEKKVTFSAFATVQVV